MVRRGGQWSDGAAAVHGCNLNGLAVHIGKRSVSPPRWVVVTYYELEADVFF